MTEEEFRELARYVKLDTRYRAWFPFVGWAEWWYKHPRQKRLLEKWHPYDTRMMLLDEVYRLRSALQNEVDMCREVNCYVDCSRCKWSPCDKLSALC